MSCGCGGTGGCGGFTSGGGLSRNKGTAEVTETGPVGFLFGIIVLFLLIGGVASVASDHSTHYPSTGASYARSSYGQ